MDPTPIYSYLLRQGRPYECYGVPPCWSDVKGEGADQLNGCPIDNPFDGRDVAELILTPLQLQCALLHMHVERTALSK